MTKKIENFRPEFDLDEVNAITNNRSKFYNEAIKEKLDSIELEYPEKIKNIKEKLEHKKELYKDRNDEINEKQKRIQVLENKNKITLKEITKLEKDLEKYSKIMKQKQKLRENKEKLRKEHEAEIKAECDFIIRGMYKNFADKEFANVRFNKALKNYFEDYNDFKYNELYPYIKKEVNENYINILDDEKVGHLVTEKDIKKIFEIVNEDLL